MLEKIKAGRLKSIIGLAEDELDDTGNIELRCWSVAVGALGDRKPDIVSWDPSWHHNYASIGFTDPAPAAPFAPHYPNVKPELVRLTSALHTLSHDPAARVRYLADPKAFASSYELPADQHRALADSIARRSLRWACTRCSTSSPTCRSSACACRPDAAPEGRSMTTVVPSWIAGRDAGASDPAVDYRAPQTEGVAFRITDASAETVDAAVKSSHAAYQKSRKVAAAVRIGWLEAAANRMVADVDRIAELICDDVGKPLRVAKFEVNRGASFFRACASALQHFSGEVVPVDAAAMGAGHFGFTRHVPYGVVGGITPFNAPVNLLVQKVGPALAAGNAIVIKPHPAGVRTARAVAEAMLASGLPEDCSTSCRATAPRRPASCAIRWSARSRSPAAPRAAKR